MRRAALALLLPGAVAVAGCATVPTLGGPAPGAVPGPGLGPHGLLDLRGQIHCHSHLSHDSRGTLSEIAEAARRTATDFVVMTDHQTPVSVTQGFRGLWRGVLFLVGAEVRFERGSLLAFPLRQPLDARGDLATVVARAHAQDALLVVAHPEEFGRWSEAQAAGVDGSEVFNLHAQALASSRLGLLLRGLFLPPWFLLDALVWRPDDTVAQLARQWARQRFLAVGAGDAHDNVKLLGRLGGTVAGYEQVFRAVTNHVLARARDEDALVAALRAGRSYVAFELRRSASGFAFLVADGRGGEWLLGATLPFQPGLELRVQTPAPAQLRLYRDGQVVATQSGEQLRFRPETPGAYWVEADLDGAPWILSNPIYLRAGAQP